MKTGLEWARRNKLIGQSLQARVVIHPKSEETARTLEQYREELADMFVVSEVQLGGESESPLWSCQEKFQVDEAEAGEMWVLPAPKAKCPRCWRYVAEAEDQMCHRCRDIVSTMDVE